MSDNSDKIPEPDEDSFFWTVVNKVKEVLPEIPGIRELYILYTIINKAISKKYKEENKNLKKEMDDLKDIIKIQQKIIDRNEALILNQREIIDKASMEKDE